MSSNPLQNIIDDNSTDIGLSITSTEFLTLSLLNNKINTKENILTFNTPINRTGNTISIDLSAYSTTTQMNTALSSKESILTFNNPINRSGNTISIDLSSYSTTANTTATSNNLITYTTNTSNNNINYTNTTSNSLYSKFSNIDYTSSNNNINYTNLNSNNTINYTNTTSNSLYSKFSNIDYISSNANVNYTNTTSNDIYSKFSNIDFTSSNNNINYTNTTSNSIYSKFSNIDYNSSNSNINYTNSASNDNITYTNTTSNVLYGNLSNLNLQSSNNNITYTNITSNVLNTKINNISSGSSQWTTIGNNINFSTGNVGIGNSNPITKLDVNGSIKSSLYFVGDGSYLTNILASSITGTLGVANGGTGVNISTGSGSNVLNNSPTLISPIISGSLTNKLIINNQTQGSIFINGTGDCRLRFYNNGAVMEWIMGQKSSTNHNFIISTLNSGTEVDRFLIDTSGNVGIGNSNPYINLSVGGTNVNHKLGRAIYNVNNAHNADKIDTFSIGRWDGNASEVLYSGINFSVCTGASIGETYDNHSYTSFNTWGNGIANSREVMRLTSRGRLGIGKTNPTELLDVNGNIKATTFVGSGASLTGIPISSLTGAISVANGGTGTTTSTGTGSVVLSASPTFTGTVNIPTISNGTSSITFNTNSGSRVIINDDGTNRLRLNNGTNLSMYPASQLQIDSPGVVGGTFIINGSGNVGIGNNNPTNKLDVNGNVKITGTQTIANGDSSYTTYGPNTTYSGSLKVGSANTSLHGTGTASIIGTDGNLHFDAGTSKGIYLNYYNNTAPINSFGTWTHSSKLFSPNFITSTLTKSSVSGTIDINVTDLVSGGFGFFRISVKIYCNNGVNRYWISDIAFISPSISSANTIMLDTNISNIWSSINTPTGSVILQFGGGDLSTYGGTATYKILG